MAWTPYEPCRTHGSWICTRCPVFPKPDYMKKPEEDENALSITPVSTPTVIPEKERILILGGFYTENEASMLHVLTKHFTDTVKTLPFHFESGGCCENDNVVYCAGGNTWPRVKNGQTLRQFWAIMWNDAYDKFQCFAVQDMRRMRENPGVVALGDFVYVLGGYNHKGEHLKIFEQYSVENAMWNQMNEMTYARTAFGIEILHSYVFVMGGWNGRTRLDKCERIDPIQRDPFSRSSWTRMKPLITARSDFATAVIDDEYMYVIGGVDNDRNVLSSVEMYEFSEAHWIAVAPMKKARFGHTAVAIGDKIYVIGGRGDQRAERTVEVYHRIFNTWKIFVHLEKPYWNHCAVVI